MSKKTFNFRSFVLLSVTLMFVVLGITGVVLYITPHGRVAYWINWHFLGFTKSQWEAIHAIFGYVFILFIIIHFFYNWRAFLGYIRNYATKKLKFTKEIAGSLLVVLFIFVTSALDIPPASWVISLGDKAKDSWENLASDLPVSHAELMSIKELSDEIDMDYNLVLNKLKNFNIEFEESEILKDIAKKNKKTPQEIYEIIIKSYEDTHNKKISSKTKKYGYGRMTIEDVAKELNSSDGIIIRILKENGFKVKNNTEKLKDIAIQKNFAPYDLYELIKENFK